MRGQETREKIMEAAIKVISNETIEGLSTRKVSGEANVNLAAIHYHHRSKDGMLIDLSRYIVNRYILPKIEPALNPEKKPEEMIAGIMSSFVEIQKNRPDVIIAFIYLYLHGTKSGRINGILTSVKNQFSEKFEEALAMQMSRRRAKKVIRRSLLYMSGLLGDMAVTREIPDEKEILDISKTLS